MVATMIDDHEWRSAEMWRNFGVLSLSFQTVRRTPAAASPIPAAIETYKPASLLLA